MPSHYKQKHPQLISYMSTIWPSPKFAIIADYKCLKCVERHSTHLSVKPKTTPAKCANCAGKHPSNFQNKLIKNPHHNITPYFFRNSKCNSSTLHISEKIDAIIFICKPSKLRQDHTTYRPISPNPYLAKSSKNLSTPDCKKCFGRT